MNQASELELKTSEGFRVLTVIAFTIAFGIPWGVGFYWIGYVCLKHIGFY